MDANTLLPSINALLPNAFLWKRPYLIAPRSNSDMGFNFSTLPRGWNGKIDKQEELPLEEEEKEGMVVVN